MVVSGFAGSAKGFRELGPVPTRAYITLSRAERVIQGGAPLAISRVIRTLN